MYCEENGRSLCCCMLPARAQNRSMSEIRCISPLACVTLSRLAVTLRLVAASISLALGNTTIIAIIRVGSLTIIVGIHTYKLATVVDSSFLYINSMGIVTLIVTI